MIRHFSPKYSETAPTHRGPPLHVVLSDWGFDSTSYCLTDFSHTYFIIERCWARQLFSARVIDRQRIYLIVLVFSASVSFFNKTNLLFCVARYTSIRSCFVVRTTVERNNSSYNRDMWVPRCLVAAIRLLVLFAKPAVVEGTCHCGDVCPNYDTFFTLGVRFGGLLV